MSVLQREQMDKAIAEVERGWYQGGYVFAPDKELNYDVANPDFFEEGKNKNSCTCAGLAVSHADTSYALLEEFAAWLDLPYPIIGAVSRIAVWNDAPERTKAEVLEKMREFRDTL